MRHHVALLAILASTAMAALPDRGLTVFSTNDHNMGAKAAIDGVVMRIEGPRCPTDAGDYGSCHWTVLIEGGTALLPGTSRYPSFLIEHSYSLVTGPFGSSATLDSLAWWKISGNQSQWAVMFDTLKNRHRSWVASESILYCFSGQ